MRVKFPCALVLLMLILHYSCYSQEETREALQLLVDFKNEKGNVQLKLENKQQEINQPMDIDLRSFDLEIRFINYSKNHLLKFYPQDGLDCDGIEHALDTNMMSEGILITRGILHLAKEDYPVGAAVKVVIPGKKISWLINTNQPLLAACPKAVKKNTPDSVKAKQTIGIAYYDAMYLDNDTADLLRKFEILKYYAGASSADSTCDQLLARLKGNDFLYPYAEKFCADFKKVAKLQGTFSLEKFTGLVSGLDVTTIANGISLFMIKRAKQELTISFFNHFKEFVASNTEFQVLFPKTTENLGNLLAYRYPEMLPALRSGFFEDIDKITYRLDDVLELPRYETLLRDFPEIRVTIRSLRLVHEIESGASHPAEILTSFAGLPEWTATGTSFTFRNFGSSVRLAAVFSESLRNESELTSDTSRAWITLKEVKRMVTDTSAFRIYLGLLYEQVKKSNINFWSSDAVSRGFGSIMLTQKQNLFLFENKVTEFIELAAKVDKVKNDLIVSGKKDIPLKNEDYYSYINTSLDVIEYGFSIARLFEKDFTGTDYTKVARNCNDLYRHIYKKEYSQAISNAMQIYNEIKQLFDRNQARLNAPMKDTVAIFSDFISKTKKYALFMANMADADSPEEVDAILENAVLPVGSSSIKKNSDFNISIQSYLGAYTRLGSLKHRTNAAWGDKVGLSAPIGLALSMGFERCGSLSLFASLFDLGAIVDYRLKNDTLVDPNGNRSNTVEKDYKIELGQIISPGAYIVYGFGFNLPLSLGVGGQWGPGLSKVNGNAPNVINNPQWRWNLVFGVDIPFFTIRNRMKNYKTP